MGAHVLKSRPSCLIPKRNQDVVVDDDDSDNRFDDGDDVDEVMIN
jgi:hypothetical protein